MRCFEVNTLAELNQQLDAYVTQVHSELTSQFLLLPRSDDYVEYSRFQDAYEILKRRTVAFAAFTVDNVWEALSEDALTFSVFRAMIGVSPPELAAIAQSFGAANITQGFARQLDAKAKRDAGMLARVFTDREGRRRDALNGFRP